MSVFHHTLGLEADHHDHSYDFMCDMAWVVDQSQLTNSGSLTSANPGLAVVLSYCKNETTVTFGGSWMRA